MTASPQPLPPPRRNMLKKCGTRRIKKIVNGLILIKLFLTPPESKFCWLSCLTINYYCLAQCLIKIVFSSIFSTSGIISYYWQGTWDTFLEPIQKTKQTKRSEQTKMSSVQKNFIIKHHNVNKELKSSRFIT